jgi:LuxR family maltose regulon positive regulatory protein
LCEAAEALADIDTVGLLDTAQALLALARLRQQRGAAAVAALTPVLRRIAEGGDPLGLTLVGPVVLDELAAAWPRGAEPALDLVLQREGERARQWQAATLAEARTAGTPAPAPTDDPLSPRERMVLERIAAGDSNKLIARALNLSPHTVKRHVANILDKLGLATRAQAAAWLGIRAR